MTQNQTPQEAWEARYQEADRIWSGRVNQVLKDTATSLSPGTALDLGCGEGGDAVWLASQGWKVTGVDLSPTAVSRASSAAAERGVDASFIAADLTSWTTEDRFSLVSASFLLSHHSDFPRDRILRRATDFVAPDGHILVVAHAEAPPWAKFHGDHSDHAPRFPTPEEDLAALALDPAAWEVLACELRSRSAISPDGMTTTQLTDTVVLAKRLG